MLVVVFRFFFCWPFVPFSYWYLSFYNVNFNWFSVNYEWQTRFKYGQIEFDECQAGSCEYKYYISSEWMWRTGTSTMCLFVCVCVCNFRWLEAHGRVARFMVFKLIFTPDRNLQQFFSKCAIGIVRTSITNLGQGKCLQLALAVHT